MAENEPTALDRYQARHMERTGLLSHERFPATWRYHATFAVLALLVAAKAQTIAIAAVAVSVIAVVWLFFAVLRINVTATHVHVQYGLFGPRIPIERIRSAEAVTYDVSRYRGSFIRHRLFRRETLYAMPGDGGRAVRLRWTDDRGRLRTTIVSCRDPDAIVSAVRNARALPPAPEDA